MKNKGPFFEGELYPEDVLWIESQINLSPSERAAIAARLARFSRRKSLAGSRPRVVKVPHSLSRAGPGNLRGSGHQLCLNIGAVSIGLSSLGSLTVITKREHCFYCGGPIDRPGDVLPGGFEPLLGVRLGDRWYHRGLCLDRLQKGL